MSTVVMPAEVMVRCRGEKIVVELFYLLLLLVLSGVFSGSETALVALSIGRVEGLLREGRHGATALYQLKKDPSRMLTTILIGNNLVNIAASVMATVIATRWFGSAGPGIAVDSTSSSSASLTLPAAWPPTASKTLTMSRCFGPG